MEQKVLALIDHLCQKFEWENYWPHSFSESKREFRVCLCERIDWLVGAQDAVSMTRSWTCSWGRKGWHRVTTVRPWIMNKGHITDLALHDPQDQGQQPKPWCLVVAGHLASRRMGMIRGAWIKEAIFHTTANLTSQQLPWKGGYGQSRCPTRWHTSLEYINSRALHSLLRKSWVLNGGFMTPCNPVLTEWPQSVCYDTSTPSLCSVTLPLSSFLTLLHIIQASLGDDWSVYGHQSSCQFLAKN
jgi:hypothetical protein